MNEATHAAVERLEQSHGIPSHPHFAGVMCDPADLRTVLDALKRTHNQHTEYLLFEAYRERDEAVARFNAADASARALCEELKELRAAIEAGDWWIDPSDAIAAELARQNQP